MADLHVVSALREKRAIVAGLIDRLERKLEQHRADLTHIDGVLRLFAPEHDPVQILPRRTYKRRTRYFAHGQLARLCHDAFRTADGALVSTDDIARAVMETKGFDAGDRVLRAAIRDQVLTTLRAFRKRGAVEQIGLGRGARWKLAREA